MRIAATFSGQPQPSKLGQVKNALYVWREILSKPAVNLAVQNAFDRHGMNYVFNSMDRLRLLASTCKNEPELMLWVLDTLWVPNCHLLSLSFSALGDSIHDNSARYRFRQISSVCQTNDLQRRW
jgi:hypothetical protein